MQCVSTGSDAFLTTLCLNHVDTERQAQPIELVMIDLDKEPVLRMMSEHFGLDRTRGCVYNPFHFAGQASEGVNAVTP